MVVIQELRIVLPPDEDKAIGTGFEFARIRKFPDSLRLYSPV